MGLPCKTLSENQKSLDFNKYEKDMKRAEIQQYLNSAFEIYSPDGRLIDKIDGPGDVGEWLRDPDAPPHVAIFPVPYDVLDEEDRGAESYKVTRIFLNEQLDEMPDQKDEMTLVAFSADREEDARAMARKYNCDHAYWSAWDENRYLFLMDVEMEIDIVYHDGFE